MSVRLGCDRALDRSSVKCIVCSRNDSTIFHRVNKNRSKDYGEMHLKSIIKMDAMVEWVWQIFHVHNIILENPLPSIGPPYWNTHYTHAFLASIWRVCSCKGKMLFCFVLRKVPFYVHHTISKSDTKYQRYRIPFIYQTVAQWKENCKCHKHKLVLGTLLVVSYVVTIFKKKSWPEL